MINKQRIIEHLSNLNLIVFFVGFDLVTSLASLFIADIGENSQLVTIPFRAFALLLSLIVLILNLRKRTNINSSIFCLFFYLTLLSIRLLYDFGIRSDIDTFRSNQAQVILLFCSMFVNIISVVKSYTNIDLAKVFKYVFIFYAIILVINFITVQEFTVESDSIQHQVDMNLRNTIATGYIAVIFILLSLYYFYSKKTNTFYKFLLIPTIVIAVIILLRAGSRGPLLSVLGGFIVYFAFKGKNPWKTFIYSLISLLIVILLYDAILSAIVKVSPVMAYRIEYTLEEGDKLRMEYFIAGIEGFLNNPFTGSYAFVYTSYEWYEYPHQLIIEAFMATGILGGLALTYVLFTVIKNIIINIRNNSPNLWIDLIAITYVIRALTAGSIYYGEYSTIFLLVLLSRRSRNDLHYL